jgi:molybdopterin molybdotransferase
MLSIQEARQQILAAVIPLTTETVPLAATPGRVLAEDVVAQRTQPPYDNSAMDGYAVRAADLTSGSDQHPVQLRVTQTIYAGHAPTGHVNPGEAARIMTGAQLPPGADAVVMQEKTRSEGDKVFILTALSPGDSVRPAGEDFRTGDVVLRAGQRLGPAQTALLASLGRTHCMVARRPLVGVFSTGDELCEVEADPMGRIVDSNSWAIAAQVAECGGEPQRLGIAPDDRSAIERLIAAADDCDVVISSAGVSVGERDFVRDALVARGVEMRFWKVAMRPGKPLAFGVHAPRLFFGLPGNPTSSMVSFELFVRPALLALQGCRTLDRPRVGVRLTQPFQKAPGLTWFVRANVTFPGGQPIATPISKQGSGLITSMTSANALLVVPPEVESIPESGEVDAILLG